MKIRKYNQRIKKGLKLNITKAKHQALKDISEECRQPNSVYSMNYVHIEYLVLMSAEIQIEVFPIINHKLYTY